MNEAILAAAPNDLLRGYFSNFAGKPVFSPFIGSTAFSVHLDKRRSARFLI
jgi:hypothetical protein